MKVTSELVRKRNVQLEIIWYLIFKHEMKALSTFWITLSLSLSRSLYIYTSRSFHQKINMVIVYIITILFRKLYTLLINSGASCSKVEPFRFRILVLYKSTWEAGVSDNIQGILIYKLCNFIYKYLVVPQGGKIMRGNSFKLNSTYNKYKICCCLLWPKNLIKYYFSDTRPLYATSNSSY